MFWHFFHSLSSASKRKKFLIAGPENKQSRFYLLQWGRNSFLIISLIYVYFGDKNQERNETKEEICNRLIQDGRTDQPTKQHNELRKRDKEKKCISENRTAYEFRKFFQSFTFFHRFQACYTLFVLGHGDESKESEGGEETNIRNERR